MKSKSSEPVQLSSNCALTAAGELAPSYKQYNFLAFLALVPD